FLQAQTDKATKAQPIGQPFLQFPLAQPIQGSQQQRLEQQQRRPRRTARTTVPQLTQQLVEPVPAHQPFKPNQRTVATSLHNRIRKSKLTRPLHRHPLFPPQYTHTESQPRNYATGPTGEKVPDG